MSEETSIPLLPTVLKVAPENARHVQDVDRGYQIVREIDKLQKELKEVETRLIEDGLHGVQVPLEDEDREGRQFLAHGNDGLTVPIVFTADKLVQSFISGGSTHKRVLEAAGTEFGSFFMQETRFKMITDSGKKFRAQALEKLGERGPAFITSCLQRNRDGLAKSDIKVEWKRAEKPSTAEGN